MNIEYLDLVDYIAIAAEVTGRKLETIVGFLNLPLTNSGLQAPQAGFGDEEFYPEFLDKAAVLVTRLTRNHPLPDGNKRSAWVALRLFIEINGWSWDPMPSVGDAEQAMLSIASGEWDQARVAAWLRKHLVPATGPSQ